MIDQPSADHRSTRRRAAIAGVIGVILLVAIVLIVARRASDSSRAVEAPSTSEIAVPSASVMGPGPSPTMSAPPSAGASSSAEGPGVPSTGTATGSHPTHQVTQLNGTGSLGPNLTARLSSVESVQGVAQVPGEIAGPALRLTVEVTNMTGSPMPVNDVVVNLFMGDDLTPALPLLGPGGKPFAGSVGSRGSATGVYVFGVPLDRRAQVTVEIDAPSQAAAVVFKGAV